MEFVHLECLNAWRQRPENPAAMRACTQCGFEYRVRTEEFVRVLLREDVIRVLTTLALAVLILLTGTLSWIPGVTDALYDATEWDPPPRYAESAWFHHLVVGLSVCGLLGFLANVAPIVRDLRHNFDPNALFGLVVMLTAHGNRGVRLFVFTGMVTAFVYVGKHIQMLARRAVMRFGEVVLDAGGE